MCIRDSVCTWQYKIEKDDHASISAYAQMSFTGWHSNDHITGLGSINSSNRKRLLVTLKALHGCVRFKKLNCILRIALLRICWAYNHQQCHIAPKRCNNVRGRVDMWKYRLFKVYMFVRHGFIQRHVHGTCDTPTTHSMPCVRWCQSHGTGYQAVFLLAGNDWKMEGTREQG